MSDLAERFLAYLNDWHTYYEPYDDKLDIWLHQSYADVIRQGKNVNWRAIYFSPSSASACPRELYLKAKRAKKDEQRLVPRQRRHMSQGTVIGDWLQRDLLLAERHYEKLSGKEPKFKIALKDGKPQFEDFVFKQKLVEHNGQKFSILGTTDGIMQDVETGEYVGLEIKSKQETPSKTSYTSMKEPDFKHVDQVTAYSEMYGIKRWLIVYVNTAKQKWFATEADDIKTPDVRAFEVEITDEMRDKVLGYFAYITKCINEDTPPKLNLDKFRFNNFKRASALSLTDGEVSELWQEVELAELGGTAAWKVKQWRKNLEQIEQIRSETE